MADAHIPTLSIKHRRRGLRFAERIAQLLPDAPDEDARRDVYGVVTRMRIRYGFTPDEKREIVLSRIRIGASTIHDLIRDTGFSQPALWAILQKLEADNLIRIQKMSASAAEVGRRTHLILPL